jgi:hypothetical protein
MGGGWKWPRIVPNGSVEPSGSAVAASVTLEIHAYNEPTANCASQSNTYRTVMNGTIMLFVWLEKLKK